MLIYLPLLQISFPQYTLAVLIFMKPFALFDILDGLEGTKYAVEAWNIWNPDDH
jgi:hypothetical protein